MFKELYRFVFEIKAPEDAEWIPVSDEEFMVGLYRSYRRTTPLIRQMLAGDEVHTNHGAYRIKYIRHARSD